MSAHISPTQAEETLPGTTIPGSPDRKLEPMSPAPEAKRAKVEVDRAERGENAEGGSGNERGAGRGDEGDDGSGDDGSGDDGKGDEGSGDEHNEPENPGDNDSGDDWGPNWPAHKLSEVVTPTATHGAQVEMSHPAVERPTGVSWEEREAPRSWWETPRSWWETPRSWEAPRSWETPPSWETPSSWRTPSSWWTTSTTWAKDVTTSWSGSEWSSSEWAPQAWSSEHSRWDDNRWQSDEGGDKYMPDTTNATAATQAEIEGLADMMMQEYQAARKNDPERFQTDAPLDENEIAITRALETKALDVKGPLGQKFRRSMKGHPDYEKAKTNKQKQEFKMRWVEQQYKEVRHMGASGSTVDDRTKSV